MLDVLLCVMSFRMYILFTFDQTINLCFVKGLKANRNDNSSSFFIDSYLSTIDFWGTKHTVWWLLGYNTFTFARKVFVMVSEFFDCTLRILFYRSWPPVYDWLLRNKPYRLVTIYPILIFILPYPGHCNKRDTKIIYCK